MGSRAQNAIGIVPAPAGARGVWWARLRVDDPRYPRSKTLATLRAVGKLGWLPVTVYLGNAATSLVTAFATHGLGATMSLSGLDSALQLAGVRTFAASNPVAAAITLVLVAAVGVLIRQAQLDGRREAAVVRSREMMQMMAERDARTMTAESLRDDLLALQTELAAGRASAAKTPSGGPADLRLRLARLTEISEMLSRDLGARAMWDALMEQQMAAWQRRQRIWSAGMGVATIAIGGLLPVLLNAGAVGL